MSQIKLAYGRIASIRRTLARKGNELYRFLLTVHSQDGACLLEVRGLGYDPVTQNILPSVARRNYPVALLPERHAVLHPFLEKAIAENQKELQLGQIVRTDIICWGERPNTSEDTGESFVPGRGSL